MYPSVDRNQIIGDLMGLRMAFMGMADTEVNALAAVVPERGEQMWQRFKAWQRQQVDEDVGFYEWVKAIFAENQVAVASPAVVFVPQRQEMPTRAAPSDRQAIPASVKSGCVIALRSAESKEDAKAKLKKVVKSNIRPRPESVSCTVDWSSDPHGRSAYIQFQGWEAFRVYSKT